MKTRIIFGVIAAALVAALIYSGSRYAMCAVVLLCAVVGVMEYEQLFFSKRSRTRRIRMVVLVASAVLGLAWDVSLGWIFLWLPFVTLGARYVVRSNETGDFEHAVADLSMEFLGIFYVVSLVGFFMPIAARPNGREYLALLLAVVVACDSFAYFVGRAFGRSQLAALLSPKKSVEGAVGGVLAAMLFGFFWHCWILPQEKAGPELWRVLVLVFVISLLAQVSDLFESMLKRSRAQKDSGSFLPGHGGLLDRLDSFALAAPAFYFAITYLLE